MSALHVVFGTGPLGRATASALLRRGYTVRMVNRSGQGDVPAGVELVRADAYQVENVQRVTQGAATVYQTAQPGYTQWVEKFPPLQKAILEGTATSGAKLIIGDNLYMYGDTSGQPFDESTPYNLHTKKGKVRAEMAEAALAAHRSGKLRVAIGRASNFYGPYVLGSSVGERMFPQVLQGKSAQLTGNIDVLHTFTYIEDFGEALAILGERDEAAGRAWIVPNAPPMTTRQFATLAYELAGQPVPKLSGMGKMMMRIGGLFIPEARETVEMMFEYEKPYLPDHSAFVRAFGNHATSIREGLRRTLDWYRHHLVAEASA